MQALNRLAKWRVLFAGWQLGTRGADDPECAAVRDHREITIVLRAEMNALVDLLVRKGAITTTEWEAAMVRAANDLNRAYEGRFPGVQAIENGLRMDLAKIREAGWMENWLP